MIFPEKRKKKMFGKKISLLFENWLILGIEDQLPNLHKLTYWFDVLTNRNAGFYIAPPPFSRNWGFSQIGKNDEFFQKKEICGKTFLLFLILWKKSKFGEWLSPEKRKSRKNPQKNTGYVTCSWKMLCGSIQTTLLWMQFHLNVWDQAPKTIPVLVCRFFFFLEKEFLQIARKKSFYRKKKKKTHGKKISLVFANWLILGIGHKLPNLHKLTYWFDVLTNRNAGFYIAPPPFSKNLEIWKNYSFSGKRRNPVKNFYLFYFLWKN